MKHKMNVAIMAVAAFFAATQQADAQRFKGERGFEGLQGPVKECQYLNTDGTPSGPIYKFDTDGFFQKDELPGGMTDENTRDAKGRIVVVTLINSGIEKYEYNADGLLVRKQYERGSHTFDARYTYDSQGALIKETSKFNEMGQRGTSLTTYTILVRDIYGNWTKRKDNHGLVEQRKITYFDDGVLTRTQIDEKNALMRFAVAKGQRSVNIRKEARTNAPLVQTMAPDQTFVINEETEGWYRLLLNDGNYGYVSKTVARISDAPLDIDKVSDHVYGVSESYEDWIQWSVGKVKDSDYYVCITSSCNMSEPLGDAGSHLWLGTRCGNHLVFTQYVTFGTSYDPSDAKLFRTEKAEWITDEYGYDVHFGDNHAMPDNQGGKVFRPSSLTIDDIKRLFNGKEQKGYLFMGPELFAPKYANVVFG